MKFPKLKSKASNSHPSKSQSHSSSQQDNGNDISSVSQLNASKGHSNLQDEQSSVSVEKSYPVEKQKQDMNNANICSNKICTLFKATKANLLVQNNEENLCFNCQAQYAKDSFCIYCKQIYFQSTDDGKEWIMCDQCQRWVHTECADFNTSVSIISFRCIKCKKSENYQGVNLPISRRNNSNVRGNATTKNNAERRKSQQECMLNNYGFYWQLGSTELAEDIEKLKMFLK